LQNIFIHSMGTLRIILALLVVFSHLGYPLGIKLIGPKLAVQTFYIISGFYMALVLSSKYKNLKYGTFIGNRILRLWPAYLVVLILTAFISLIFGYFTQDYLALNSFITYYNRLDLVTLTSLSIINFTLFFQDLILFLSVDEHSHLTLNRMLDLNKLQLYKFMLVPQSWTLALELMFYLISPWLVRLKLKSICILMSFSLLIRVVLAFYGFSEDPWDYRFFPSELIFFLAGILMFRISKFKIFHQENIFYSICLVLVVMSLILQFYPTLIAKIIYLSAVAIAIPILFEKTKLLHWDRKIGELSYPIYISHFLFIFLGQHLFQTYSKNSYYIFVIAMTVVFSIIIVIYLDPRIDRLRVKRIENSKNGV